MEGICSKEERVESRMKPIFLFAEGIGKIGSAVVKEMEALISLDIC